MQVNFVIIAKFKHNFINVLILNKNRKRKYGFCDLAQISVELEIVILVHDGLLSRSNGFTVCVGLTFEEINCSYFSSIIFR